MKRLSKQSSRWLVALFFLTLTLVGLLTSADYGQPWDEPWEQDILRLNGNQYASFLGLSSRMALQSDMPAPASLLIADSVERDHGQSAYYPLLWLVADTAISPLAHMVIWHGYTWLLFMGGVAALWLLCRRLGLSRLLSSVAALFLVLTPRMFAEGHYNNKDVVLLSLVLMTLWLAARLMERPTALCAVVFSLAGAAAANTKIIGLLVWGLCALFVLLRQVAGRRMDRQAWSAAAAALLAYGGFYFLLTPAMWQDPLAYLRYVLATAADFTRWQNYVLFRGSIFHLKTTPLPRYYLPYMILVTTPLWVLFFLLAGQLAAIRRWLRRGVSPFAEDRAMLLLLCTLLWLVPIGYAVLARPTTYNGWRHFYFLYAPMLVLAAHGLHHTAQWLSRGGSVIPRRIGAALLALCMGASATQIAISHPYQYTFYNALAYRENLPAYLELDYWNVSALDALRAVVAQVPDGEQVSIAGSDVGSHNGLTSAFHLLAPTEQARLRLIAPGSKGAAYTFVNQTYAVLNYWQPPANRRLLFDITSFGVPIYSVYAR